MQLILLSLFAFALNGDGKKLIINEQLGFTIRQINLAVQSSTAVEMPVTLSLKKNIPNGINKRDMCNEKTKAMVNNEQFICHIWP